MSSTTATADATAAASTIEWTVLEELLALGGRPFVEEVLTIFLDETPPRMAAIRDAFEKGNIPAVRQVAHALAGGGGQIGAVAFSALARECEEHAVRGENDALAASLSRLHAMSGPVLEALTTWLALPASGGGAS